MGCWGVGCGCERLQRGTVLELPVPRRSVRPCSSWGPVGPRRILLGESWGRGGVPGMGGVLLCARLCPPHIQHAVH